VFGGNTYGNTTVYDDDDTPIASKDACETKCTEQRDYCQWFTYDEEHLESRCILYSGTCASGT
jgi:hypothetical protein